MMNMNKVEMNDNEAAACFAGTADYSQTVVGVISGYDEDGNRYTNYYTVCPKCKTECIGSTKDEARNALENHCHEHHPEKSVWAVFMDYLGF